MWGTWSYCMEVTRLFHFASNLNVSITHWNCFQNENVCGPMNKEEYSFAQPNHWQSLKNGTTLKTSQRFMYSLGIGKMLTVWKGRTHKVWTPQGSVIVPHNMKHNVLVMHKCCSELRSCFLFVLLVFLMLLCVFVVVIVCFLTSAVPQQRLTSTFPSWKKEGGKRRKNKTE